MVSKLKWLLDVEVNCYVGRCTRVRMLNWLLGCRGTLLPGAMYQSQKVEVVSRT
jgi:hypothetical protein